MIVNGKEYPMWSQFIEKKDEWIGGTIIEHDMGTEEKTTIVDITLDPNGEESAMFNVVGENFTCGFDVGHGGITRTEGNDDLTFSRMYMGTFGVVKE